VLLVLGDAWAVAPSKALWALVDVYREDSEPRRSMILNQVCLGCSNRNCRQKQKQKQKKRRGH